EAAVTVVCASGHPWALLARDASLAARVWLAGARDSAARAAPDFAWLADGLAELAVLVEPSSGDGPVVEALKSALRPLVRRRCPFTSAVQVRDWCSTRAAACAGCGRELRGAAAGVARGAAAAAPGPARAQAARLPREPAGCVQRLAEPRVRGAEPASRLRLGQAKSVSAG
ncbi:unnamed protein product, partial [Prorocentrum cordatum]